MYCKLYKITFKGKLPDNSRFLKFQNFYEEHGVKVIGGWENVDKKNELYFMTGYTDESHYTKFVSSMKENTKYQELTQQMATEREAVEVTTLSSVDDIPGP